MLTVIELYDKNHIIIISIRVLHELNFEPYTLPLSRQPIFTIESENCFNKPAQS